MRTLLMVPNPDDGTSFYRALGVFEGLRKEFPEIQYEVMLSQDILTWSTVSQFDLFFMQRPFANIHIFNAVLIKKMKKPLIVDYDDNFFAIPEDNVFYPIYSNPEIQKNIYYLINTANSVWVSTANLRDEFMWRTKSGHKKIQVIPNAFNDYLFDMEEAKFCDRPNMSIMWRGGNTHHADLRFYSDAINRVVNETKVPITFYGDDPKGIITCEYSHEPFRHIIDYFETLRCRQHQVCIVPLVDSPFNRAKSNCSWIEATYGGANVVAPVEWRGPGMLSYHNIISFEDALRKAISATPIVRELNFGLSKDYILENLLLSDVNDLRAQSIEQLVG